MSIINHGLNYMPDDSYFIRLSDNKEYFLHFEEATSETEATYVVNKGCVGAAIWRKQQGESFIVEIKIKLGAYNLELVKVREVLGNDGTLN